MSTCQRCATSDWHPDVQRCTFADCELLRSRLPQLRGHDAPQAGAPTPPLRGAPATLSLPTATVIPGGRPSRGGSHCAVPALFVEAC